MSDDASADDVAIAVALGDGIRRYLLSVDGEDAGELDIVDDGGVWDMVHTGVRERFEGRGLAAKLVRKALDDARADGVKVRPTCPYVAAYLQRHPDDADLVA